VHFAFIRWWNQPVSGLKLRAPLTVHPEVTVQDALRLLSREGFDQVPVIDETGYVEMFSLS
jgi:cystathionine beta-synthase